MYSIPYTYPIVFHDVFHIYLFETNVSPLHQGSRTEARPRPPTLANLRRSLLMALCSSVSNAKDKKMWGTAVGT